MNWRPIVQLSLLVLSEMEEPSKRRKLGPNKLKEVDTDLKAFEKEMHELYDSDKEEEEPVDFMREPEEEERQALRPGEEMVALESDIRHKLRVKEDRKDRKRSRVGKSGVTGRGAGGGRGREGRG